MDGGLWHHLNEKEIWPNQGVFSEWMKFQSRKSCLRGEDSRHFCINSHGWSNALGWWVRRAVSSDLALLQWSVSEPSTEAAFSQRFQTIRAFQPGDFTRTAKTRLVPTFVKLCSGDEVEMLWLPALQFLVLRNLFCSFVSLYHTTFS